MTETIITSQVVLLLDRVHRLCTDSVSTATGAEAVVVAATAESSRHRRCRHRCCSRCCRCHRHLFYDTETCLSHGCGERVAFRSPLPSLTSTDSPTPRGSPPPTVVHSLVASNLSIGSSWAHSFSTSAGSWPSLPGLSGTQLPASLVRYEYIA